MLRTHSPLSARIATSASFDLHVLSTPPAFILSQDQTLRMTSTSLPERRPVYVWRLLIDCRVHDPAVGSTVPPKWDSHPKLLTMVLLPTTLQLLRCRSRQPVSAGARAGRILPPRAAAVKRDTKTDANMFVRIGPVSGSLSLSCLVYRWLVPLTN